MSSAWTFEPRPTRPKGRMTRSQRAFYLIGAAVLEQLTFGPRDPDSLRAVTEVINWVEFWLSQEDLDFLEAMGLIINVDANEELQMSREAEAGRGQSPSENDGIPF